MTKEFLKDEILKFEPFHVSKCDEAIRETVVNRMKHCLGMDRRKVYHRHGRAFYKPYRNYYACRKDDMWEAIVELGYANVHKENEDDYFYYSVTESGRNWLGCLIGVFIHEEER